MNTRRPKTTHIVLPALLSLGGFAPSASAEGPFEAVTAANPAAVVGPPQVRAADVPPAPGVTGPKTIGRNDPPEHERDIGIATRGSVDLDYMAAYIDTELEGNVVGYAYVINEDGVPARQNASGYARTAQDGLLAMSVNTRSYVASVNKQLTAAATIKLLDAAGVPLDSPIAPWLPSDWDKGAGFDADGVTFVQLLRHDTGLGQIFDDLDEEEREPWGNDWDGLEWVVANGASPGIGESYKNANFALLRVLLPRVWVSTGNAPYASVTKGNHSLLFISYLQQHVLEPAGVFATACHLEPDGALAYSHDFVETGGVAHTANFANCGGHAGLRLSAMELAAYLAHLQHGTDILGLSQRAEMDQGNLGWSSSGGGGFHWHSGANFSSYTVPATNSTGGQALATSAEVSYRKSSRACVIKMPYGVEASLVINSEFASGSDLSPCGVLKKAFELFAS